MTKTKRDYLVYPLFVLALLLAASLACGETTPTSEPKISTATPVAQQPKAPAEEATNTPELLQAPTDVTEPTEAPTATSEPEELYLGDVVEEDGYLLSAVTVEVPAEPSMFYEPQPDTKLVAIEVIVGNVSGEVLSVNPLNATLVDDEGYTYQAELGAVDGQIATIYLSQGEKVRGWIPFAIAEGATPTALKYAIKTFGDHALRAGLMQPPEGHSANKQALETVPPEAGSKLGDVVEQHGYSLSAMTVEDPATPGMFYEPQEGYKLVAIEIVVGNVSGDVLSVNPLSAALIDSRGFVYEAELGARDGQIDTVDLGAGEKAKGWVAFSIPEEASPDSIKYVVEIFSDEFLRTGLGR